MHMHRPTSASTFPILLAACILAAGAARAQSAIPEKSTGNDVNVIVDRMERAQLQNRAHYRPYTVTRDYRMYSGESRNPASEVVAQVNFVPPDNKSFDITQAKGSSRGEKVVRNILKEEQESAPHYDRNSLTRENYQFRFVGEQVLQGRRCYVLELIPKRKAKDLVEGRAWVDVNTYLVHRVEGDLSKSPSWWLKGVRVEQEFGDQSGMWLPTRTRAVADVRWFGAHSLESQAVNFKTAETVAQNHVAAARKTRPAARPTRPADVAGAIVFH